MSPIGRIFIVINLVLAAGFLFWASLSLGTAENWKTKHNNLETSKDATIATLEEESSQLKVAKEAAENDLRDRREERDSLQSQSDSLKGDIESLTREKEKLSGDLTGINGSLKDYAATIESMSSAKDRAMQDASEKESSRRDAADAQAEAELAMRDAQDAQAAAERMVADLQELTETQRLEISSYEAKMATLAAMGVATDVLSQPNIDAAVLDVRMDLAPGLVVLNVGNDQEVKRGYVFDIYNGRQYKGRVRVENVDATMCSALVIGTNEGATIQRGDRASTHI